MELNNLQFTNNPDPILAEQDGLQLNSAEFTIQTIPISDDLYSIHFLSFFSHFLRKCCSNLEKK